MLYSLTIANFKGIKAEVNLGLRGMTVVAGANSSGKSTLLQSLLLLAQTARSSFQEKSLELNGKLFHFGSLDDITDLSLSIAPLTLGLSCRIIDSPMERISITQVPQADITGFESTFTVGEGKNPTLNPLLSNAIVFSKAIDAETEIFSVTKSSTTSVPTMLKLLREEGIHFIGNAQSLLFDVEVKSEFWQQVLEENNAVAVVGCELNHFLPSKILVKYDERKEMSEFYTQVLLRASKGSNVYFSKEIPQNVWQYLNSKFAADFPEFFPERTFSFKDWSAFIRKKSPSKRMRFHRQVSSFDEEILEAFISSYVESLDIKAVELPSQQQQAIQFMQTFLSSKVRYLGPLRDEPRSRYPLIPMESIDIVGIRGELTAAVLHRHRFEIIEYLQPGSTQGPMYETLEEAVNAWLNYLGLAEAFDTEDSGKFGHSLRFKLENSNSFFDSTHVGVGLSQVLPVIVQGLLSKKDDTLIFEQPELHCHPRVQSRLADFFLSLTLMGRQCIVETHSEYIVKRMRTLIAEDLDNTLNHLIQIYFASRSDGETIFRNIEVNEYGAILDWPPGFFDEAENEGNRLIKSAILKKSKIKKDTNIDRGS